MQFLILLKKSIVFPKKIWDNINNVIYNTDFKLELYELTVKPKKLA